MSIHYNGKINVRQIVNCQIIIGEKKDYVINFYRSRDQNHGEFEHFLTPLENLLSNIRNQDPAFTILIGELNARSKNWWVHNITKNQGTQTEFISSLYGFSKIILDPTHIFQNSSFCIDLIFTNQHYLELNRHLMRIVIIKSYMLNLTCK